MKNIRSFACALVAMGLMLGLASAMAAQADNQATAKVIRVKGNAQVSTDNGTTWVTLNRGDLVKAGSVIRTAANSRVDLSLGESELPPARPVSGELLTYQPSVSQNVIRIWEDSILAIDKLTASQTGADEVTETELDLRAGHIFGKVKRMTAASSYRVKIPNGVAAIRGTIYDLNVEGLLKVLSGTVVLNYKASDGTPKTQTVTDDQKFDAKTGELVPLPDLDRTAMLQTAYDTKAGTIPPVPAPPTPLYVSPTRGR